VRFFAGKPHAATAARRLFMSRDALTSARGCYSIFVVYWHEEWCMVELTVEKGRKGAQLHELLREACPGFSEKMLNVALKTGIVTLNGQEARGDDAVREGDVVRVFAPPDALGLDMRPRVVYQDENFVFVDKPAGLPSASEAGEPNAVDMVEAYMKQRGEYSLNALMVPYLIYPLDKYVSGLLLMAKHEDAYLFMVEALAQRRIARYYICPVVGQAEEKAELMAYHLREKNSRQARILPKLQKDSKPIVTRYQRLAMGETLSLLRVRPVTNALHQIRAHLAYAGLPVLGDDVYGNKRFNRKAGAAHTALWLHRVVFEVGTAHSYAYINGLALDSTAHSFPKRAYDEGLLE
jgi:RluA family pseudouridine synthase